jgi:hypothetical protein
MVLGLFAVARILKTLPTNELLSNSAHQAAAHPKIGCNQLNEGKFHRGHQQ